MSISSIIGPVLKTNLKIYFGVGVVVLALTSCQSPMAQDDGETQLKEAIDAAIARQGASPIPQGTPQVLRKVQSTPNSVFETLAGRIPELDAIGPQGVNGGLGLDLGPDTTGATDPEVQLSLKSAIAAAVRNNLSVQGSRIEQSIAETDVVKAEAAFDAVLLAGSGYQTTNVPPPPINIPGGLNDAFAPENSQTSLSTGIQKRLISGGTVAASVNMINTQQSASIYDP